MNIVFIIPTGVGAEIGGHAGDANPAARLIGSVCNRIILHPNVVNGSDINEMPTNALYVDGNMLDEFLAGNISLRSIRANKVLAVVNPPLKSETVNAISACRTTLGVDTEIIVLNKRLILHAYYNKNGLATGYVEGTTELINQIHQCNFDALAILTGIEAEQEIVLNYFKNGGVNPWGAVESMACRPISKIFECPVAHALIDDGKYNNDIKFICDPRMAAEFVSVAYLFCIIKGLHKAPRWSKREKDLWVDDIDLLISPNMTFGTPHNLCIYKNIPILVIEENKTILPPAEGKCIRVANYTEAAGWVASMHIGISPQSVRRPIKHTTIIN